MCRRSSQIVSLVIALLCGGVTRGASPVVVPSLPPSDFADTEIVTNVPFSAGGAHDREFIESEALPLTDRAVVCYNFRYENFCV